MATTAARVRTAAAAAAGDRDSGAVVGEGGVEDPHEGATPLRWGRFKVQPGTFKVGRQRRLGARHILHQWRKIAMSKAGSLDAVQKGGDFDGGGGGGGGGGGWMGVSVFWVVIHWVWVMID